jgi:hypothetical protein
MLPALRRVARWAGPALALLLGVVLLAGSLHQHSDLRAHDDCALCAAAHAPAAASTVAVAIELPPNSPHPFLSQAPAPCARLSTREASTRAPPSS